MTTVATTVSAIGKYAVAVSSTTQIRNEVGRNGDVRCRRADRRNNLSVREDGCWSWFETRCQRERVYEKPQARGAKSGQFHLSPTLAVLYLFNRPHRRILVLRQLVKIAWISPIHHASPKAAMA